MPRRSVAGDEMVGRVAERAEVVAALDGAGRARGGTIVVLGEAGMGKSTLAGWAVARAREAGLGVARGGCSAAGMPALWPWRRALADLVPGLPWRDGGTAPDRELLAAAVVEALADASRDRPLLLVLEDLHWADPATLLVARAVADAAPTLPLTLLLTSRDEQPHLLATLPAGVRRMLLPPLDAAEVATLAGTALADPAEVEQLRSRTGGNPFFVAEVLRLRRAHGQQARLVVPPGVRDVLERRLARLSQPCVAELSLAAVAAETAGGRIETDLLDAPGVLDEAAAAQLVDEDPGGRRFRHALVREVLDAGLTGTERARLHGMVAERLERRGAPPARLAHHWSRAGDERAAPWSLRAARAARDEYGFEAAAAHFRRALAAPGTDRIAVSVELGEALQLTGDTEGARTVLLDAAREATDAGRPEDLARAALALGGGLAGFEVPLADDRQAELLERADRLLPAGATALRAAVRGRLSLARAGTLPPDARIALAEDALRLARACGDVAVECAVLAAYCDAIAGPDHVPDRIAASGRIVELAGGLHLRTTLLLGRRLLVLALLESGDLGGADAQAHAYERTAAGLAVPRYAYLPETWRGMRALLVGDTDEALRRADLVEAIGRRANSLNAEFMAFTVRMQAHLDRGTPERFAADVRAMLDRFGPTGLAPMYVAAPARLLLAAGDPGPARTVLRAFRSGRPEAMPRDAEWLESHYALAELAIALDDREATTALYATLLPYAGLWAVDGIGGALFGVVDEPLGRLAAHLGRPREAAAHLAAARDSYREQGTPALLARLGADDRPAAARLHRDGATWQVEWQGRRTTVPDAKGLHDLAILVRQPGRPVPALQLVEATGGPPAAAAGGDLGPVLDDTARRAYRRRILELDEELEDADLGRAGRLRAERDMLTAELAAALGLGGRPRSAGDGGDRARKAVTMRIRAAIRTIDAGDPALGRHLSNAIRTGRLCSYEPESPVDWQT